MLTREETENLLAMIKVKEPNELIVNSWWVSFVKDYKEALQMAIKSLEAWEKLIKFAESEQENNGTLRVHINDIKKFYKEVEDGHK